MNRTAPYRKPRKNRLSAFFARLIEPLLMPEEPDLWSSDPAHEETENFYIPGTPVDFETLRLHALGLQRIAPPSVSGATRTAPQEEPCFAETTAAPENPPFGPEGLESCEGSQTTETAEAAGMATHAPIPEAPVSALVTIHPSGADPVPTFTAPTEPEPPLSAAVREDSIPARTSAGKTAVPAPAAQLSLFSPVETPGEAPAKSRKEVPSSLRPLFFQPFGAEPERDKPRSGKPSADEEPPAPQPRPAAPVEEPEPAAPPVQEPAEPAAEFRPLRHPDFTRARIRPRRGYRRLRLLFSGLLLRRLRPAPVRRPRIADTGEFERYSPSAPLASAGKKKAYNPHPMRCRVRPAERGRTWGWIVLLALGLSASSCSTTKRIADGEVLYTGVKKMKFEAPDSIDVPKRVISRAKDPLSVKPNNPLISPYIRTPLPIGLWAWNYLYTDNPKGFRSWLYRRFAKTPVLISDVKPWVRVQMADQIFENYGYFGVETQFDTLTSKRNPKKARVSYHASLPPPHVYDTIEYLHLEGALGTIIDSLRRESYLREGAVYNMDSLVMERQRIADTVRNLGYYYFRPDYIRYLADSTQYPFQVSLRMQIDPGTPPGALHPFEVGPVTVSLFNPEGGEMDSLWMGEILVRYQQPLKLRPRVLRNALSLDPGELYTVRQQDRTLSRLNRLGVFSSVSLTVPPVDSLTFGPDSLPVIGDSIPVLINGRFDRPMEGEFEANVTSKSNSFVGPGAIFRLRHKNLFRGAEVLTVRLTGSYEWQTGNKRQFQGDQSLINSYEFGFTATLDFPRLIAPGQLQRDTYYPSHTSIQIGADILNRAGYFNMLSANGSLSYTYQTSRYSYHTFTPFKLVYNKLLHTSDDFDRTMAENPALAQSFANQFIPSLSYTYTYDRTFGRRENHRIIWQTTAMEAGNILSGAYSLFGSTGTKHLFGTPFSQFVKGTTEARHYYRLGENSWLVSRLLVGAAWPFGNSDVIPYSEQFYIGGANSIRAFTVRSLGPGSYHPASNTTYSYWDQTGTFILEGNIEYRFPIAGNLNGAAFMDAGNIWLLKKDPRRPGALLTAKRFWDEIALGTGVGLRYDLNYLVVRLDLGIGLHVPYDTGKSGYYNIPNFRDGLGLHLAIGYPF